MKAIMLSIRPEWCEKILSGEKTIEIRKTEPKLLPRPFKCYIYETKAQTDNPWMDEDGHMIWKGRGAVVAEFICDNIIDIDCDSIAPFDKETGDYIEKECCMDRDALWEYIKKPVCPYGWHISDLKIYDKPKDISDFEKPCIMDEQPYCPSCEYGYELICEEEAERYEAYGTCDTEWLCFNRLKRPPQSWCYVEELEL